MQSAQFALSCSQVRLRINIHLSRLKTQIVVKNEDFPTLLTILFLRDDIFYITVYGYKRHDKAHSILNLWGIKVKITIEEPSFSSCTLFLILL